MDGRDAQFKSFLRRGQNHGCAIHPDFACIRLINSSEYFDKRGFASAIFTNQRGHLTGVERQVDVAQSLDTRK